jgi:hypothetical protein
MRPLVHFAAFLVCRLEEHLKEILPVLFRDANSIVLHSEFYSDKALVRYLILLEFYVYCLTLFAKLDRVLNKVDQDLLHSNFVD